GYEKRFNWGVGTTSEQQFVEMVLAGQPEPPLYFAEMKRINRDGPAILGGFAVPAQGARESLSVALGGNAVVLDLRPATEFAKGHIPGTINIPLNKSFNTWAGWLVKYDQPIHLIVDAADALKAVRELAMIGLDHVAAWYAPSIVGEWEKSGQALGTVRKIDVAHLAPKLAAADVTVIDVRNRSEYEAGHLPGSLHIPIGYLPERLAEIPRDKPVVLQCQSGARSAIATSLLQKLGVSDATDLVGGFVAWASAGKDVVRESATAGV
ncbi:MAG: MBL fold metallo-hydrolase, partial [Gemmatimonas sp.]|nr:MBL fold metallo-hydrolase [Gemmatimonas sp.]